VIDHSPRRPIGGETAVRGADDGGPATARFSVRRRPSYPLPDTARSQVRRAAVLHLEDALAHWKRYAAIRDAQYVPAIYNRVGYVDVIRLTGRVANDIDIARNWTPGTLKNAGRGSDTEKGFRK